jgi:hypothetical protein
MDHFAHIISSIRILESSIDPDWVIAPSGELPAINKKQNTIHIVGIARRQERRWPGNILGLADPAHRNQILILE